MSFQFSSAKPKMLVGKTSTPAGEVVVKTPLPNEVIFDYNVQPITPTTTSADSIAIVQSKINTQRYNILENQVVIQKSAGVPPSLGFTAGGLPPDVPI
jgi:hypothetical protein